MSDKKSAPPSAPPRYSDQPPPYNVQPAPYNPAFPPPVNYPLPTQQPFPQPATGYSKPGYDYKGPPPSQPPSVQPGFGPFPTPPPGYSTSGSHQPPGSSQFGQPRYLPPGPSSRPGYGPSQPGYGPIPTYPSTQPSFFQPGGLYSSPASSQPGYYSSPVSSQPGYPSPASSQPGYPSPATSQPGYPSPATSQPGYPRPATSQPGYPSPASSQPGYFSTASTQPTYTSSNTVGGYPSPLISGSSTGQLANQLANMRVTDSPEQSLMSHGAVVILKSQASKKSLRINNGEVEGTGGTGALAQFKVHVYRPGVVALQNISNPDNWLAVYQNKTIGTGTGDVYCEFLVVSVCEGRFVCLESTQYPGQYVGVLPSGAVKAPDKTKTGPHGRFQVIVHQAGEARSTNIEELFQTGNIVILKSVASNKSLRINNGRVEGVGGDGALARFKVHRRKSGAVVFQNVANPDNFIAIHGDKTIGTGKGGPFCDFTMHVVGDGRCACFESVKHPGKFLGILPNGSVKPPASTRTGPHGRFIPRLCC